LKSKRDRLNAQLKRIHAEYRELLEAREKNWSVLQEKAGESALIGKLLDKGNVPSTAQLKGLLGGGTADLPIGLAIMKEMRFQGIGRRADLARDLVSVLARQHEQATHVHGAEAAARATVEHLASVLDPQHLSPLSREVLAVLRAEGGDEAQMTVVETALHMLSE